MDASVAIEDGPSIIGCSCCLIAIGTSYLTLSSWTISTSLQSATHCDASLESPLNSLDSVITSYATKPYDALTVAINPSNAVNYG